MPRQQAQYKYKNMTVLILKFVFLTSTVYMANEEAPLPRTYIYIYINKMLTAYLLITTTVCFSGKLWVNGWKCKVSTAFGITEDAFAGCKVLHTKCSRL